MTQTLMPKIRKATRIDGKAIVFRNADKSDASFIVALRTDERKGRYLSPTVADVQKQEAWLEAYAYRDNEAYFVIESKQGEKLGTIRLYDPRGDSFCWGSWILKEGAPQAAAIESALMVYAYALDTLGFTSSHFDVRKDNERVWRFHERFGAERVGETDYDYLYRLSSSAIAESRKRYLKFLPSISVEAMK